MPQIVTTIIEKTLVRVMTKICIKDTEQIDPRIFGFIL